MSHCFSVFIAAAYAAGRIEQRNPRLVHLLRDLREGKNLSTKNKDTFDRAIIAADSAIREIEAAP
jgi:hypothetical protein